MNIGVFSWFIFVLVVYSVSSRQLPLPKFCCSDKIGFLDVLLEHPARIEKGTVERYAVEHDIGELVPVVIKERDDSILQFLVERGRNRAIDRELPHRSVAMVCR